MKNLTQILGFIFTICSTMAIQAQEVTEPWTEHN
jgi:hypothetical protein